MFALNDVMKKKKITSQALADRSGIPKRTIDEYRSGRRKEPAFSTGLKIAEALEVDPRELIKEDAT
ncbi:MAG: helix-turn-helix domain-containing protein [Lachnospiraceae bacterium]